MFQKKSLGQNFLTNTAIIKKIVRAGEVAPQDPVLEIGPGKGSLTRELLETGATVTAIEKDSRLIPILEDMFAHSPNFNLREEDIKDIDIASLYPKDTPYKVIANIPYYITGFIIRLFLSQKHKPERMGLLLQKEVVQRIIANDSKESLLSISIKAYGEVRSFGIVKAGSFSPAPKVDSAILGIFNITKERFIHAGISEDYFFSILKCAFAGKRKMLLGKLSSLADRGALEHIFEKLNIDKNIRAEDVMIGQWFELTASLYTLTDQG